MPALDDMLTQKIAVLESKQAKRSLRSDAPVEGAVVLRDGRRLVSFSGNDYLGLSQHEVVKDAAARALAKYGAGAGASRLVTGNNPLYDELEQALAVLKHTADACVFGSGYLANLGTIPALVGRGDLILADKLIHACMLDAARLSGATVMRFAHNNVAHCRMLLQSARAEHHNCIILTETVFSMDGDRAPMRALKLLASEFDAWLMCDDAHAIGVLPSDKASEADIVMGTLSKAAGSYGGYVCGSATLIEYLKTAARSLIYSTALPPATLAASAAAIGIIGAQPQLVAKPMARAWQFGQALGLADAQSAIVPLMLETNERALKAASQLEEQGFLVAAIRPPTVPENTARLRFAFSALHEEAQVEALAVSVKKLELAHA